MSHRGSNVDRLIAVSKRLYVEVERSALEELDGSDPIPELLHLVLVTWLDEAVDSGFIPSDDPRHDQLSGIIASYAADMHAGRRRG